MSQRLIRASETRRLLVALICQFQDARISQGRMPRPAHLKAVLAKADNPSAVHVAIDDATLGIDSLALLDLTMEVTRFFNLQDTGVEDFLFVQRSVDEWAELIGIHFDKIGANARFTFHTSGSTGKPKSIEKPAQVLLDEISALINVIKTFQTATCRLVSMVAPQHIYGFLWSVLLPNQLGLDVVDCYGKSPHAIGKSSRAGDVVLGTPYLWEKAADYGAKFHSGAMGICSAGPTTATTWQAFDQVGLGCTLEIFGSTETGGVGFRNAFEHPFRLFDHLYRNAGTVCRRADESALELQDSLTWEGTSDFRVIGRKDDIVQVAGTNVSLGKVRSTLEALDCISDLSVRFDGKRLKAFIVPRADACVDVQTEIWSSLKTLPAVARPGEITFGSELPRNAAGKLCDW